MKKISPCLFYIIVAAFSGAAFSQPQLPSGDEMMPGYYGRPGAASLGVLGRHSIEELTPLIKAKADEYGQINGDDGVKPVLKYLSYNSVHLAIDPEFEVNGLDVRPGRLICHVTGEQINEIQSAMADHMTENGIKKDKPEMMTPRQVLGMDPVGKTGIKQAPKYINYQ